VHSAARAAGWASVPAVVFVSSSGHVGVAEALARAIADLESGRIETAIVGGVDSLLEERTLAWLDGVDRLKSPRVATGLPPGEAGAVIVLRSAAKTVKSLTTIRAVGFAAERQSLLSGDPSHGEGLAAAIADVADAAAWDHASSTWIVSDHNGETYRAREWGYAVTRLLARWPAFANPVLWYPAASLGDTAGASGAVALCLVVRAFVRGYAPGDQAIITSSADGPGRSAVLAERPKNGAG
jgi:3-oxoacyl-[acyl-carrier-protein] synthase-1